jgi:hypothetical protein
MKRKSGSSPRKIKSQSRRKPRVPLVVPQQSTGAVADFWRSKSVEELAREQGVKPVEDPNDLKGDFWPEDESVDEFLAWLGWVERVPEQAKTDVRRAVCSARGLP